jgi:hypothetical protein
VTAIAEAQATGTAGVQAGGKNGVGQSVSGTAAVKEGAEASENASVGKQGVKAGVDTFAGAAATANGSETVNLGGNSATGGAGVKAGDSIGFAASAQATDKNGVITIGGDLDVDAILGIDVNFNVSINTKQDEKDVETAMNDVAKAAPVVAKVATTAAKDVAKVATTAVSDVKKAADDVGHAIASVFSGW